MKRPVAVRSVRRSATLIATSVGLPVAVILVMAAVGTPYIQSIAVFVFLASMAAMALTVLMGIAGQPSLLTSALLLAGGYSAALFNNAVRAPIIVTILCTFLAGAAIGMISSIPSLRLTGLYLLLSTLAVQTITIDIGNLVQTKQGATSGYFLANLNLGGFVVSSTSRWVLVSGVAALLVYHYLRYAKASRLGRGWTLIREAGDGASRVAGIAATRYVVYAYGLTSGITALSGLFLAFYTHNVSYDGFSLLGAVSYIVMIVLGGMGSLFGAVLGAIFVTALPYVLQQTFGGGAGSGFIATNLPFIEAMVYGLIGVLVLVFLPVGLSGIPAKLRGEIPDLRTRWRKLRAHLAASAGPAGTADAPVRVPGDLVLQLEDVSVGYPGGEVGLAGISLDVPSTGAVAVLGRNGAGKTTLLHSIVGFPARSGARVIAGDISLIEDNSRRSLLKRDSVSRVRLGLILVPADDKVFTSLKVRDHLLEALATSRGRGSSAALDDVLEDFPALRGRMNAFAHTLSGGERQQLALATAIARNARVLLVDEASLGLSPIAISTMIDVLREIKQTNRSLVLVEQSPPVGFAVADRVIVLDGGKVQTAGPPTPELMLAIEDVFLGVQRVVEEGAARGQDGTAQPIEATKRAVGEAVLRLEDVSLKVGGIQALSDVSLMVEPGEALGLIGPNGAGKTSLLNVVCGHYRPQVGRVRIGDQDFTNSPGNRVAGAGVGRTFQSPGLFRELTVREFVQIGFEPRWNHSMLSVLAGLPPAVRTELSYRRRADELLEEAGILGYADTPMGQCPYGIRKMADIVRSLAGEPRLLLLDEPSSGVPASERPRIARLIRSYQRERGAAMLLVDHDVDFVTDLCDRLVVLSSGSVIAAGARDVVLADPEVVRTFIGTRPADAGAGSMPPQVSDGGGKNAGETP